MKFKSDLKMLLYITVGIVFLLITAANIYAYRVINSIQTEQKDLKDYIYTHLEKAMKKARALGRISNLKLDNNITRFDALAQEAYSEKNLKKKKLLMEQCSREVKNVVDRLNASDEERTALIDNETHFIGHIYIILIICNALAFAAIFFVIILNDRGIRRKEDRLNSVNANFHAIMEGLDSVLISFDSSGIIQTWNRNAERYFELNKNNAVGKNLYELVPAFKALKGWFDKAL